MACKNPQCKDGWYAVPDGYDCIDWEVCECQRPSSVFTPTDKQLSHLELLTTWSKYKTHGVYGSK